jgi:hypothetical protein
VHGPPFSVLHATEPLKLGKSVELFNQAARDTKTFPQCRPI